MYKEINKMINKESEASYELKLLSKDEKLPYEKSKEIDREQNYHWDKLQFLKNLNKALSK